MLIAQPMSQFVRTGGIAQADVSFHILRGGRGSACLNSGGGTSYRRATAIALNSKGWRFQHCLTRSWRCQWNRRGVGRRACRGSGGESVPSDSRGWRSRHVIGKFYCRNASLDNACTLQRWECTAQLYTRHGAAVYAVGIGEPQRTPNIQLAKWINELRLAPLLDNLI